MSCASLVNSIKKRSFACSERWTESSCNMIKTVSTLGLRATERKPKKNRLGGHYYLVSVMMV